MPDYDMTRDWFRDGRLFSVGITTGCRLSHRRIVFIQVFDSTKKKAIQRKEMEKIK